MKKLSLAILGFSLPGAGVLAGRVPLAMSDESGMRVTDPLRSPELLSSIPHYKEGYGTEFIHYQTEWFQPLFLYTVLGMLALFLLHYLIIGPKRFSHEGKRYYVFSLFMRIVHWIAALGFVLIVPTGLMMVFSGYLGGGEPLLYARYLHSVGTVLFGIALLPMLLVWFVPMLPTLDDIKWLMIMGGYLSKKRREIPAGKFNAGQKFWFWLSMLGGLVMIATGALMYFQSIDVTLPEQIDMALIEKLRLSALIHNFLGIALIAMFIVHLYLSLVGIKGALGSMIDGYKSEDELKHLHSSYYRRLSKKAKSD